MKDVKQASFRLNTDDAEKFKAFCEESEMTAAQGFAVLMEVMELDRAGRALPARQTEIEHFEQLTKGIVSAFLHSLELNENAEIRVREQFSLQLESQNRTIADYQNQVSTIQLQLEEASDFAEAYRADLQATQDRMDEAEKMRSQIEKDYISLKEDKEKQLADKDNIIAMLSEKLMIAERKAEGFDDLNAQNADLRTKVSDLEQTIRDQQKDAEIEKERLLRDAEMGLERAVREAEKRIEADCHKELERLRSQNIELLQTIASSERAANEQIRSLDKTNASLREELVDLRGKVEVQNKD